MSLSTDAYQEAKYSTYLNNTSTFRLEELPGFFPDALVFFYPRLQESPPRSTSLFVLVVVSPIIGNF
jgi:hypothetical protein